MPREERGATKREDEVVENELGEKDAIRELKARYFRFMDTKQWSQWRTIFTDDVNASVDTAVTTFGAEGKPLFNITGADALVKYVQDEITNYITVHHGHMSEIEITSPTSAKGTW